MSNHIIISYIRKYGLLFIGISLFIFSLPLYESWSSRLVWQRWSYEYMIIIIIALSFWIFFLIMSWRETIRSRFQILVTPIWKIAFHTSIFFWGLAYFLSSLHSSANAAKIFDLNLFGSTFPVASALEWMALVITALTAGFIIAPKLTKRWRNLGLLVGTVLICAILGEGIARIKAFVSPETQGFPTYSQHLWQQKYVVRNSFGFRDIERQHNKAHGVQRIIVIGDSVAFGAGLANVEDRFSEQFNKLINQERASEYEVINAGHQNTHTLQHIETLKQMLEFNPDMVILLYVFNDMDYILPSARSSSMAHPSQGALGLLNPIRILFLNSYIFQEFFVRFRKMYFMFKNSNTILDSYADNFLLRKHFEDLNLFVSLSRDTGASILIVPMDYRVGSNQQARARYWRFLQEASTHRLPVCSLEHTFDGHSIQSLRVNELDGHPNALVNWLMAKRVFDCLYTAKSS